MKYILSANLICLHKTPNSEAGFNLNFEFENGTAKQTITPKAQKKQNKAFSNQ